MSKGNPVIQIRIPPDLLAELREIARKEGKTVSEYVRELLFMRISREKLS